MLSLRPKLRSLHNAIPQEYPNQSPSATIRFSATGRKFTTGIPKNPGTAILGYLQVLLFLTSVPARFQCIPGKRERDRAGQVFPQQVTYPQCRGAR